MSDVDRRETGLCPGKNDVTVWIVKIVFFKSLFTLKKSVFPRPRIAMKRFLSSRSSSQQELQPLDDVRAERAAIALSVGLSWPPGTRRRAAQLAALGTCSAEAQPPPPRRWDLQRCVCEVQRLCPEPFVGILGYVLRGQPTGILRVSSAMKRKVNAWKCAPLTTDRDPANVNFNKI